MQTSREWADELPGQAHQDDAPVPLHILHAQQSRAQRDRMLLLLLAFFAVAVAATMV
jgi:hypothetical protein